MPWCLVKHRDKFTFTLPKNYDTKAYRRNVWKTPYTLGLDGGEWSSTRSRSFIPGHTYPGIHFIGGWVGHRVGLDIMVEREILALSGERNIVIQPVASHYIIRVAFYYC
jgi:hypothetical protein